MSESNKKVTDKNNRKLSDKIQELEEMVDWFYSDEFNLDDAEEKYRKAMTLSKEIEDNLNSLENKIEVINQDFSSD